MRYVCRIALYVAGALLLVMPFVYAQGNGFPSGPHFNLLIHGKGASFTCPPAEYQVTADNNGDGDLGTMVTECDPGDVCVQVFGNVVNIPRIKGEAKVSITLESGLKGPRSAPATTDLEVTDWCTESFPDYGSATGDAAVVRLPKDPDGYAVYARVLGKPGQDGGPIFNVVPELALVMDEWGNDLLLLGYVTQDGVFDSTGLPISRYDSTRSGKGAKAATNISGLFNFNGDVCYLNGLPPGVEPNSTVPTPLCCDLVTDDAGDHYSNCGVGEVVDGALTCPDGSVAVTGACTTYENKWVFNIADFVDLLWDVTADGAYNVQIRFYPLPLLQSK